MMSVEDADQPMQPMEVTRLARAAEPLEKPLEKPKEEEGSPSADYGEQLEDGAGVDAGIGMAAEVAAPMDVSSEEGNPVDDGFLSK